MKRGKHYRTAKAKVDKNAELDISAALKTLEAFPTPKFDESVDCAVRLNVNPRHADQMVRGTVVLPNGTGRTVRVLALVKGEHAEAATAAGADMVGADDYLEKIKGGWADTDVIITTPDMMRDVGKLGKILGPKGLMPNPKSGTVTQDVAKAVKEVKAGKVEYRVDKGSNIHVPVGKISFEHASLEENVRTLVLELIRAKPATAKGKYIRSASISSSHGPAVKLDEAELTALSK